ncbi:type IV pilus modification protein PilV [Coralloluteibacterium stylophorae]|uniref:Type IV pilus modification protein PilV n=1 Tax=Coralloluteibacterium stylophorae TaxID=1776034 RepID=A0A8J7VSI6_9GAMM|nr:type IV pilus modification protein PilV [Coralloluteibacterium stylophorae]MBS7458015.1 type IV pilus modification protein PilV [Coralloluteibacterium stylophorae]
MLPSPRHGSGPSATSVRRAAAARGPGRAGQRGVGLIEVLIAVLVLGVGLLGIAALQALALRNNQDALARSQAVIQTYAILDLMRADREAALAGAYNIGSTCSAPAGEGGSADAVATWIQTLHQDVDPEACGSIRCGATRCEVTVRWDEGGGVATAGRGASDAPGLQSFAMETRL